MPPRTNPRNRGCPVIRVRRLSQYEGCPSPKAIPFRRLSESESYPSPKAIRVRRLSESEGYPIPKALRVRRLSHSKAAGVPAACSETSSMRDAVAIKRSRCSSAGMMVITTGFVTLFKQILFKQYVKELNNSFSFLSSNFSPRFPLFRSFALFFFALCVVAVLLSVCLPLASFPQVLGLGPPRLRQYDVGPFRSLLSPLRISEGDSARGSNSGVCAFHGPSLGSFHPHLGPRPLPCFS